MDIAVLGPLEVEGNGGLSRRDRVVLAALAMNAGDVLSAERLADAVWGDSPPKSWPKVVQGCVLRLRQALGRGSVVTTTGGYRLEVSDDEIDVRRFERLVARGRSLEREGEHRRASAAYAQALALWRGPALTDLEQWPAGRSEAVRLEELRHSTQEALLDARLATGDDCVADATSLVAAAPLRERRWSLLALALYRSGRQGDALAALRRARASLRDELGLDPSRETVELERAILNHDPGLGVAARAGAASDSCPYKGLLAYERDDADWFFGRAGEVDAVLQVLTRSSVVAVVGPSGCGKSSLVRAGVAPALERAGSACAVMTPGIDPLATLAATMSSVARERVLVVDQFEELFTARHSAAVVEQFLDQLTKVAGRGMTVIVVLRADQVGGLSASPAFARLVEQGMHLVTGMTATEIGDAIEGPSRQAGLRMEPGLVELLLREVEDEPGALPLLSHALAETWERRDSDVLTVEGYRATGGIRSSVAQTAEQLYATLPSALQSGVRAIFLRLVGVAAGGEPTVTRVPLSLFSSDPERARLLDMLADARLVTTDERSVAVAHEAVIRAWPRLRSWLDQDVDGQRMLRHLTSAAEDWQASGRQPSELYRGARLDAVLEWRQRSEPELTPVERSFLDVAAAQAAAEKSAKAQQARHRVRQNRRLRAALAGTALGLVLAVVAGSLAVQRSQDATDTAHLAQVERLVAESVALRATRRDLSALLALEAYRLKPDATTRSALFGVFTATPSFLGYGSTGGRTDGAGPAPLTSGRVLPDGHTLLATGTDGIIRTIDLETGDTGPRFPRPPFATLSSLVDLSQDGRTVAEVAWEGPAQGGGRSVLEVFDTATRRLLATTSLPLAVGAVAVSPRGRYVAVSGYTDGRVLIYDTANRRLPQLEQVGVPVEGVVELPVFTKITTPGPRAFSIPGQRETAGLAFRHDGMLVAGSLIGNVRIVDPKDGRVVQLLGGAPELTSNNNIVLSPDESILVTTGTDGLVRWNLRTGRPERVSTLGEDTCWSIAMLPVAGRMLCGGRFGQVREVALDDLEPTGPRFDMQRGRVSALAVSSDGRTLLEMSDTQPVVARWRLDGTGLVTRRVDVDAAPHQYSADGRWLLVTGRGQRRSIGGEPWPDRYVVDAGDGRVVDRLRPHIAAAWTTRARRLAVWDSHGAPSVSELVTGRHLLTLQGNVDVPVEAVAATGGSFLMACGVETACDVWDLRSGDLAFTFEPASIGGASITASGRYLTWSGQGGLETYDTRLQKRTATRPGVTRGAVSPTGVVAGSRDDGRLGFYDVRTLRPVGPLLSGAPGPVEQLEFTRDGRLLAMRGSDGAVRLIDVASRLELGEPIQLSAALDRVARSAGLDDLIPLTGDLARHIALRGDGTELALPDARGIVFWDLRLQHWVKAACSFAGRNLTTAEWRRYLDGPGDHRRSCPSTT